MVPPASHAPAALAELGTARRAARCHSCGTGAVPVLRGPAVPYPGLSRSCTDPFLDRQFPLEDASVRASSLLLPAPGCDGQTMGPRRTSAAPLGPLQIPCPHHRVQQSPAPASAPGIVITRLLITPLSSHYWLLATQTAAETSPQTLLYCLQCEPISWAAQHLAHPPAPQHLDSPAGPP